MLVLSRQAFFIVPWLWLFIPVGLGAEIRSSVSFEARLGAVADSLLVTVRVRVAMDSALIVRNRVAAQAYIGSKASVLIKNAADSLDQPDRDSLVFLTDRFLQTCDSITATALESIAGLTNNHRRQLNRLKTTALRCAGCSSNDDSTELFEAFADRADSVADDIRDSLQQIAEADTETVNDTAAVLIDSLETIRDNLIDHRQNIQDSIAEKGEEIRDSLSEVTEKATRLIASVGYQRHANYRGRDFNLRQQTVSPSVAFHHHSGFTISFTPSWFENESVHWNELDADLQYDHKISSQWNLAGGYTHEWFLDSSFHEKFTLDNSIEGTAEYRPSDLAVALTAGVDFGSRIESSFALDLSYEILCKALPHGITSLSIAPAGHVLWGDEGDRFFGVLDYELSLPLLAQFGTFTLTPAVEYIIPMNLQMPGTKKPFVNINLTAGIGIKPFSLHQGPTSKRTLSGKQKQQ